MIWVIALLLIGLGVALFLSKRLREMNARLWKMGPTATKIESSLHFVTATVLVIVGVALLAAALGS